MNPETERERGKPRISPPKKSVAMQLWGNFCTYPYFDANEAARERIIKKREDESPFASVRDGDALRPLHTRCGINCYCARACAGIGGIFLLLNVMLFRRELVLLERILTG